MTGLPAFEELHRRADARSRPLSLAVAGGADSTVLRALEISTRRGWIRPLVIGPELEVRAIATGLGVCLEGMQLIDCEPEAAATLAVREVRSGRARALMKGMVATPELMKSVLDKEAGLRTDRVICQVVLMEIPRDNRRFLLADTGITVHPGIEEKDDILRSAVEVAQALGVERPKVALVAATETVKPSMPETVDADRLTRRYSETAANGFRVAGPLSFDLAYNSDAGSRKQVFGAVVGAADVMIFPDLLSANLTVKAIMYTADCHFGGILRGTSAPVVFMSRADDTATRLNSMALMLAMVDSYPPVARGDHST